MNVKVIFDSKFGNTKQLAQIISNKLTENANLRLVAADHASWPSLSGIDLLVIGSPTERWRPTKTVQAFLEEIPHEALKGLAVAAFDTRLQMSWLLTGSAARAIAERMKKKGGTLLLPPESFFVKGREGPLKSGESERAVCWADEIMKRYETLQLLSEDQKH